VPISVGIFGLGEIIKNLRETDYRPVSTAKLKLWPTREDFRRATPAALRGTVLGCIIGILPGGGATLSSFMAYMLEKRVARDPSIFGKGAIEGVASPEAANNAGAQTSFIPMLTLGIPGNAVMAVMVAALMIHGINPGPGVITDKPDLFWGIIASMFIGNVMLVIINLPLIGIWISLLRIPYRVLYLAIIAFCAIGTYAFRGNPNDVLIAATFGVVGYFFIAYRCEPAPLLLGFVLGPRLEENLLSSMLISGGDPMIFVNRPISLALFLTSLALLLLILIAA
jgi:TctA family transporter